MRALIKKYLIESDPLTAWLLLKAPVLAALFYWIWFFSGNKEAIGVALFFFPYVFLLFKNLWFEVLHDELLKKLKIESGLETEQIRKLLRILRIGIAALGIAELFILPVAYKLQVKSNSETFLIIFAIGLLLIFTVSAFLFQIRFSHHIGQLLNVVESGRKFNREKEAKNNHRLKTMNYKAFRKAQERIKKVLGIKNGV